MKNDDLLLIGGVALLAYMVYSMVSKSGASASTTTAQANQATVDQSMQNLSDAFGVSL